MKIQTYILHYNKLDGTRANKTYRGGEPMICAKERARLAHPTHNFDFEEQYGKMVEATPEEAEALKKEQEEANEWWEREGKYECEMEERGESKYFHYENDRRAQFGRRPITARQYLGK